MSSFEVHSDSIADPSRLKSKLSIFMDSNRTFTHLGWPVKRCDRPRTTLSVFAWAPSWSDSRASHQRRIHYLCPWRRSRGHRSPKHRSYLLPRSVVAVELCQWLKQCSRSMLASCDLRSWSFRKLYLQQWLKNAKPACSEPYRIRRGG